MERGKAVDYIAHVQIMKPEEADASLLGFDPFDVTKVWPKDRFPVCSYAFPEWTELIY
jgi:catalase